MHTQSILLIALTLQLNFWCCARYDKPTEDEIFNLDLENCRTSIDLKLSDLMDSCWLLPLETKNESLLTNYFYFVHITHDLIIIADRNGIYKFSTDGKFISKPLSIGRGPGEISGSCRYYYHEDKNLLFIDDDFVQNDRILCYDIKSERFLPPIKKCFPTRWLNFIIYKDSLILASIQGLDYIDPNPYAVFVQNFKGEFITGIKSNKSLIHVKDGTQTLQRMIIYTGDKSLHVSYFRDDTIFTLKDNKLTPYLIPYYKNRPEIPKMIPDVGYKQTNYESYENKSFLIFSLSEFAGWTDDKGLNRAYYKRGFFSLNKSNGKYALIKSCTDDLRGEVIELGKSMSWTPGVSKDIPFPSSLPNNTLYLSYFPYELLKKTSNDLENQGFPKSVYSQLNKIRENLSETDNPVLFIGVPKKKLDILK